MNEIALAYLHYIALIGTASLLVGEHLLLRPGIGGDALRRLARIDGVYAGFAVAAFVTGLMRVFWGAKGAAYYGSNTVFHAKFGLFVLIGLLSIVPTVRFIRWSRALRSNAAFAPAAAEVSRVLMFIRVQLLLLLSLPLLAAAMARGVTRFGQFFA